MEKSLKERKLAIGLMVSFLVSVTLILIYADVLDVSAYDLRPKQRRLTILDRIEEMRIDFAEGRFEQAYKIASPMMDTMPSDPEPAKLAIACLIRMYQPGKAKSIAKDWVRKSPTDFSFQLASAQCSIAMGLVDEGKELLQAIRDNKKSAPVEKEAALSMMLQTDLTGTTQINAPPKVEPMPEKPTGRPPWLDMPSVKVDPTANSRTSFKSNGELRAPRAGRKPAKPRSKTPNSPLGSDQH